MDHLGCEKKPNDGRRSQHQGAGLHGELHALPHPVQPPRTVVEAYYRLKPLAEADDDGHDEGKHLGHDPHGGHRRVAVEPRIEVQRHGGHTGHALPQEGWQTAFQDVSIHLGLSSDEPGADPDVALPSHKEGGQDSQADALAEQGGDGRPGDAHVKGGLVTGETDDDYIVLTDIQGLEDFFGDMDFKVAGTHDGITAIQMDIKIHGLTRPIIEEAIAKTKEAREYILTEVMEKCIAEPRKEVSKYAPKIVQIQIDPDKIGDVVGQRGKTINAIIDETGVKIDIDETGAVSVCGTEKEMMDKALNYIKIITTDFKEGQIFTGKVVSIKDFGAFVEFAPGKEGMVHISKIAKERINRVEDVLTLGDEVKVICLGKDKMGRISFSIKDVPEEA